VTARSGSTGVLFPLLRNVAVGLSGSVLRRTIHVVLQASVGTFGAHPGCPAQVKECSCSGVILSFSCLLCTLSLKSGYRCFANLVEGACFIANGGRACTRRAWVNRALPVTVVF
jgi:hypothetical protein